MTGRYAHAESFRYNEKIQGGLALDNVAVTFPDKGLVAILGESGSGKSTLFHVLTGAVKPDCGEVTFNGERLNTDGKINSKGIFGVIFQDGNLLEGLSVSDNLSICRKDSQKQRDMLSALGIERYFNSKAGRISGGEQQRTAIARPAGREFRASGRRAYRQSGRKKRRKRNVLIKGNLPRKARAGHHT